jgi:hypothetical protein
LNRAKLTTVDIKNVMNPLWEPLQIPSGHSVTDMIRAVRRHCQKIHQYGLLIRAYRIREEYKTNVWDTEEKRLKYADSQAENLEIPFSSIYYVSSWVFGLSCLQSSFRLCYATPLLVPPMTIDEEAEFGDDDADQEDVSGTGKKGYIVFIIYVIMMIIILII